MAKSREKTQQLGFWDPEVSTPVHDEIVLWAYRNADQILKAVCGEDYERPWDWVDFGHRYLPSFYINGAEAQKEKAAAEAFMKDNPRPRPQVVGKTLEMVLKTRTGHKQNFEKIVGYADLVLEVEFPFLCEVTAGDEVGKYTFVEIEVSTGGRGCCKWPHPSHTPSILVEAKSAIPSLGELIRQLNLYREAFTGPIVVVSPDARHAEILEEQGVVFVLFPSVA